MRKFYVLFVSLFLLVAAGLYLKLHSGPSVVTIDEEEEEEGYDGPAQRDSLEAMKTLDPALGYVPYNRLFDAIAYTEALKQQLPTARLQQALAWEERGPIFDSLGPSNGNTRAGVNYTSGRIRGVLVDTLNDPTGNTVFAGGVAGGIWRCTNFLAPVPNWRPMTDFASNLAIASICQNPANPSVMYFATGEGTSNADAVLGKGVWKSTDAGNSWNWLPSTDTLIRNFRIACDAAGNVYVASRPTATPQRNLAGMLRSTDGGATFVNITPAALGTGTATATCTDMEISSTGKLYASFGYTTAGTTVRAYVTTNPATVTQTAGWTLGTGIRTSGTVAVRMELAAIADTVYAVTINTAYNTDSCYKSVNGGVTWTKQNTVVMPAGLGSGQGWYNLTLGINPSNTNEIMSGGLDAYRSTNAGATWQRVTYWVTTAPYVHADHHFIQWSNRGGESRILIGSDGGLFLSRDNGVTFIDKNRNLAIKQFYGAAIHPYAGSPYLIAGAQDNGNHQLKYPGLGPSNEVVGGDGAYVHINQQNPQVQYGAYVYNQYRRSLDGGNTWGSINVSTSAGLFINPFDYDDAQNILYGCYTANNILRMSNANLATVTNTVVPVALLNGSQASALKVSPYTANRLFIGSTNGRVLQVDAANGTPTATLISGTALPSGYINCVNTGATDNNLVVTFTNYGINNVWVTGDGGTTWTAIDGNLPDMPVRWALFEPGRNDRMILATEAGIYTTDLVNGAATVWAPNTTFPTVRTDMLKMRTSDSTMVAATHGRGLFTAKISAVVVPQVSFLSASLNTAERTDSTTGCRRYADYTIGIGLTAFANAATTVTLNVSGSATEGSDFDITTNGSFISPSKTLSFDANTATTKYITVRVYDDKEVEALENLVISYTVSGSNAVAGLLKTYTLSIDDNDSHPVPYQAGAYALGTYNADLGVTSPFNGTKLRNRLQVLYTAAELRAAGLTQAGKLNALTLRVKNKSSTTPFNGFSISLMNTATTTLNSTFIGGGDITQVYSGNYSTVVGNNSFAFNKPFQWDGSSNLLVQFCYDNTGGTAAAAADSVEGMATPLGTGIRGSIYSNWLVTSADVPGCFLAAALVSDNRVNATFSGSFGSVIATTLNSNGTEYLTARNDNYFYASDSQVLARITNLGATNYGCTQVTIDRAGTGAVQFWNTDTAAYLMSKTYRIVPSANAATGQTEVTFFFTRAEKEGWERATGKSWNDIQIVKLPSAIRNVTPQTAQPDGPATVEVVNAVKRNSGTEFYTLSAVFNTGLGAYGFGVPGRMNTLLVLSGSLNGNGRDIDLRWTTSAEINSNIFQVEKSYDGITYHVIGNVPASGTKLTPTTYPFVDGENVADNYYRIRMLHTDGYVLYSNVVYIRKDNAPNDIFVTPNPFVDRFNVRFSRTPTGNVTISLFDAGGKLYTRIVRPGGTPSYDVPAPQVMAKGTYLLQVVADGRRYGKKVVRN